MLAAVSIRNSSADLCMNECMPERSTHLHNLRSLEENLGREILEDDVTEELAGTGEHGDVFTLQRSATENTSYNVVCFIEGL